MKLRTTLVALATAAALVVIPTTAYAGGNDDCRDGHKWSNYKYAPPPECPKPPKDRDHRDPDKAKPAPTVTVTTTSTRTRQATYEGRVLKTG